VVVHDGQDLEVDLDALAGLAQAVLQGEGVEGPAEMQLLLVDVDEIARLNEEHLDGDGPTDVLAFPIDGRGDHGPSRPGGELLLVGDVVLCPAVARVNADAGGTSLPDELALLTVHGTLHLLGHDHDHEAAAQAMRARERRYAGRAGATAPAVGEP